MNQDTRLPGETPAEDDLLTAYTAGQILGKYRAYVEKHFTPDAWMRMEGGTRRPLYRASKIEDVVAGSAE